MKKMNPIKIKGINLFKEKQVYFPAEDSILLSECIQVFPQAKVLDLGCGTGLIGLISAKQKAEVLCSDINPVALKLTQKNAEKNKLKIEIRKSNLFSKIKEKFDLIYFNPPYLEKEGKKNDWLEKALNGGKKGRKIIDKFIPEIKKHLKENGKCFFLQSDLNGIKETENLMKKEGLEFKIIKRKKLFFEELVVFEAQKNNLKI